SWQAIQ
nr:Chain B, Peptide from Autophagy-related protein 32 [Saccharomyces cerevisiae S288C]